MSVSLCIKNIIFTILQPGVVVGLFPYLISRSIAFEGMVSNGQYLGFFIFIIGLIFLLMTIFQLAVQGKGTLSPIAPTKVLACNGFYKYSRNPMYMSVIIALIGLSLTIQDTKMTFYTIGVSILFNVFVLYREEPRLRTAFGPAYLEYQSKVRRWI